MREDSPFKLPKGYKLDLIGDPDVIVLRREDDSIVARFTHSESPLEIRHAAAEDQRDREQ